MTTFENYVNAHKRIVGGAFLKLNLLMIILLSGAGCSESEIDNTLNSSLIQLDSLSLDNIPLDCFVETSDSIFNIQPWYSYEDSICYFFLPSLAELNNVYLTTKGYSLYAYGKQLGNKTYLSNLGISSLMNEPIVSFVGNWGSNLKVVFLKSHNVPSLFLKTGSGSLDNIHKDKNNVEPVNISLLDEKGELRFSSLDYSSTIKGRGHGTWTMEKKPYLLKLSESTALLGMGKGKKWVLLANAADETNLRNWIAFRIAEGVGLKGTPKGKYVDVYANGNYLGLYFMTEKVSPKLVKKGDSEPVLVRIDDSVEKDSFKTNRGTIMEVDNVGGGDYALDVVKYTMNHFEDVLFSGQWDDYVDIDSWAKKYLVDEITENGDAGCRSNYFYYYPGSLYVYGGPIWDYDLSLGRTKYQCGNPKTFIARREWITPDQWTPHYSLLLSNPVFKNKVKSLFISHFIPVITSLMNSEIEEKFQELKYSRKMNKIRWRSIYALIKKIHRPTVFSSNDLISYLSERVSFLRSAYVDGRKYHLVQMTYKIWDSTSYMCFSVEDGRPFHSAISFDLSEFPGYHWIDRYTGEDYDSSQIVTKDRQFIFK